VDNFLSNYESTHHVPSPAWGGGNVGLHAILFTKESTLSPFWFNF
jgi:hypothetical protein